MTGPHPEPEDSGTRPISVAELLAKNGTIGAPAVTRRRRRRRGDNDAVTVAELTGDLPVIRDDDEPGFESTEAADTIDVAEPGSPAKPVARDEPKAPYWSEPEPRWPKSPPQPKRAAGPERSEYPRPLPEARRAGSPVNGTGEPGSGAEDMSFDPMDHYADVPVDVMDSEVREAEPALEDSAYVRSFLRSGDSGDDADEDGSGPLPAGVLRDDHLDVGHRDADAEADAHLERGRFDAVWRGGVVVLQSMLAVAFGGGLFVAFDQLWRWNSLVALVLSVLVILGLVAGVRVVRKTEDIASTLIAVAVGALITLGPLALSLQSG
ncbi:MAG: hypothetical protein VX424_16925 [Actinomycetota bacterium]|nr:hypothetical protein [Actinomycetota bacterium]